MTRNLEKHVTHKIRNFKLPKFGSTPSKFNLSSTVTYLLTAENGEASVTLQSVIVLRYGLFSRIIFLQQRGHNNAGNNVITN
jgi:hypothetical protein